MRLSNVIRLLLVQLLCAIVWVNASLPPHRFQFMWRIGDAVDAAGIKCFIENDNGRHAGSPTTSDVLAYAWVYSWPSN